MSAETLAVGIQTTVIGIAVVFLILVILMVFIKILDKIIDAVTGSSKKKAEKPAPAAAAPVAAPAVSNGIDPKTVALIMAAVSAYSGRSMRELHFTSIRRNGVSNGVWGQSGVSEIITTRQSYV